MPSRGIKRLRPTLTEGNVPVLTRRWIDRSDSPSRSAATRIDRARISLFGRAVVSCNRESSSTFALS